MKNKISSFVFLGIIFSFSILHLLMPDQDVSYSERRHLTHLESPSIKTVMDRSWTEDFEDYTLDQFPLRDSFRSLKANAMFHGFHLSDNNNLYINNGHIIKMEYPLNEASLDYFITKLDTIQKTYFKNNNVFLSLIPDKNSFSDDHHLKLNYDYVNTTVRKMLPSMKWIPIDDLLSLDDYYRSDIHWKQENLAPVAERFSEYMDFRLMDLPLKENKYEPFYGGYYGQAAMPFESEALTYLTSNQTDDCRVWNYEKDQYHGIYTPEKLTGMDSYDVFLSGASPLLIIENPAVDTSEELIIFRDSFGSSLAPLMVNGYHKITLIDLRYIPMDMAADLINIQDQDVLFLYCTTLVNNSFSLK